MRADWKPLERSHDDIPLHHCDLIMVSVFDAIRRVGQDEIVVFDRHVGKRLSVVNIGRIEAGVDVNRVARERFQIHLSAKPSFRLADTRKWRKSWKNGLNRVKNVAM